MIVVETATDGWTNGDWSALAERSIAAALSATPFAALTTARTTIEISVRLASDAEVHGLNRQYRQQDKPTNVLSFPMVQPDLLEGLANTDDGEVLLGDIVLAHETCTHEATERGVSLEHHVSHLIVHGTLHLLGYDHMAEAQAGAMEGIERDVMAALGLHDPYPLED